MARRCLGWVLLASASACAAMLFAFARGQDVNSDQLNYHLYSAYAFVHGRLDLDAAPAQLIHSYFNPLAYLPFYALFRMGGSVVTALALSAAQSLNIVFVAAISAALCRGPAKWACVGAAVAISIASPMALSELGTSFIDTLTSLPILAAVLLLVRMDCARMTRLLACGALAGLATALKLTNATFAVGLVGACLLYGPGLVARVRAVAALSVGLGLGFLGVGGAWCWALWSRFGNPVFPYYNNIFRSPDFPLTADIDRRYLPGGFIDAVEYPFRWAVGIVPRPELGFTDIRFAALICLLAVGLVALLRSGARGTAGLRLVAFFGVSFVAWLGVFAIQRYAVTLELLCGPVAIVAIGWLVRGRGQAGLGWVLAVAAWVTVTVPDWGHRPFLRGQYAIEVPPALAGDALYFMAGQPVSYVIPSLPAGSRFFGIMDWEDTMATAGTRITRRIVDAVSRSGDRAIRVVANGPLTLQTRLRLGSYGVQPTGLCHPIPGFAYANFNAACDLAKTAGTAEAALTVEPGTTLDFSRAGPGFLVLTEHLTTDWHLPGPFADLRAGRRPAMVFRRSTGFAEAAMRFRMTYAVSVENRDAFDLAVRVNGARVARPTRQIDPASGAMLVGGCVPMQVLALDPLTTMALQAEPLPGRRPAADNVLNLRLMSLTVEKAESCL